MVEGTRENFQTIGKEEDIFKKTKLTADSGFHSEKNMEMVIEDGIDAYIADNKFRHRDPRFADSGQTQGEVQQRNRQRNSTGRSSFSRETSRSALTKASASALPGSGCTNAATRFIMDCMPSSTTEPNEIAFRAR